mgnify:CR=1 FL=1
MSKFASILLLILVGCGSSGSPAIPPTEDDFVKNENGVGTAKVFGIHFRVDVDSNGASTKDSIKANFVSPEESHATKQFSFGDEITIQLDSVNESEAKFVLNTQDFGNLKVGDEVVIDDKRNVKVNGTARPSNDSDQSTIIP